MINIKTLPLQSGVPQQFAISGNYFRILDAEGVIKVQFDGGGYADMLAGLGYSVAEGYRTITLESAIDQHVVIAAAVGVLEDSRLVGKIRIDDVLRVIAEPAASCHVGAVTVDTTAVQLLPPTEKRRTAVIQAVDGDVTIGVDSGVTVASGVIIPRGGALEVSHSQAVFAVAAATVDVRYMEEVNP